MWKKDRSNRTAAAPAYCIALNACEMAGKWREVGNWELLRCGKVVVSVSPSKHQASSEFYPQIQIFDDCLWGTVLELPQSMGLKAPTIQSRKCFLCLRKRQMFLHVH